MHAIADHVVDSYLDVTDLIETDIDAMEEDIFSPTRKTNIECIYLLKREVVELRRAVAPLTLGLQRIGTRPQRPDLDRGPPVHARRARPQHPGVRPDHQLRRDAQLAGAGRSRQGGHAAEHRHAQDLGVRRHRRGANGDRRHIRDELRLHARAQAAVGLSRGAAADGRSSARSCSARSGTTTGSSSAARLSWRDPVRRRRPAATPRAWRRHP